MGRLVRRQRGYSLMELLVVLGIIGILVAVAARQFSSTTNAGPAVRGVVDEVEGVLMGAQHQAATTSVNSTLITSGTWTGTDAAALLIDGRPFDPTDNSTDVYTRRRIGSDAERLRSTAGSKIPSRDHQYAAVDVDGSLYTLALGGTRQNLKDTDLMKTDGMKGALAALADTQRLCTGSNNRVDVSGTTKRFLTGFHLVAVGMVGGKAIPNGPIAVLVVPANSPNIYKFYLPQGEGATWQRM